MFNRTLAINKLLALTKRKRVIQGGTWAGKTQAIISILINRLILNPSMDLTIVAENIPAIKAGALKIFKSIMRDSNRWNDDCYNATDRLYTYSNGAQVVFSAFDLIGKAKAAGKRTELFINEAQYVPLPIAQELMIRTSGNMWFDYNPNNPFWVHEELIGQNDVDFIILTFTDNHTTPESTIDDFQQKIERAKASSYWANWVKVYVYGQLGSLEGVIFDNWGIIDPVPSEGLIGYGMDFGYSSDPTTWIACYKVNGVIIFDELIYQKGLSNSGIAKLMISRGDTNVFTYADSAEPKSIDEIWAYGVKVRGATKGKDSVNFGISILQEERFMVTSRSLNMIKELREYCWDTDKEGKDTQKPIGIFNHCIDAMRYFAMEVLAKSNQPRARTITLGSYH